MGSLILSANVAIGLPPCLVCTECVLLDLFQKCAWNDSRDMQNCPLLSIVAFAFQGIACLQAKAASKVHGTVWHLDLLLHAVTPLRDKTHADSVGL